MKKQETFTDIEYSFRKKKTKREEFLEIMDEIIPWDEWVGVIEPYYPKGKRGRPPMGMVLLNKYMEKPAMSYFGGALKECDLVIILGMGGSLAKVITTSGIGDVLSNTLMSFNMPILVLAFILSAILRVALSSGTTAMLTTVSIFAPIAAASGASPVLVGLTICAATVGMLIHTDTAFWMASGLFDIDQKQVLRSVSLPCTLASIVVFLCILLLNAFSGVLPGLY